MGKLATVVVLTKKPPLLLVGCNSLQEKAYLYLDEGYIFGKGGRGFERINIACPKYVLEDGLNRLKKVLDNIK